MSATGDFHILNTASQVSSIIQPGLNPTDMGLEMFHI